MHPRRIFLIRAAQGAAATALAGRAAGAQGVRLDGVIAPVQWGEHPVPVSGTGKAGTAAVDAAITAVMRRHGIVGCGVGIVRDAEVVYAKGFGFAELPQVPFLPTTASRCGSLAKPLTGLCALVLADEGKLSLDAPVLPILRERGIGPVPVGGQSPDPRIARILVRHLLDHTSGLSRSATYTAWRPGRDVAALHGLRRTATAADVACDALGNFRLNGEPGSRHEYANANFVLLARVIEARSRMTFNDYLTSVALPRFGVPRGEIYVSRNQESPTSPARGKNEAAYYQTSPERFVSYHPAEAALGPVFGEAYRGYSTEAADGGGGIACSAAALAALLANLGSSRSGLSKRAIGEILTPPPHYRNDRSFDPAKSKFYSKGWEVRLSGGRPWVSHGGMTQHCGGIIGYNAGYQFVAVSNWNSAAPPYVDVLLDRALTQAVADLRL